MHGSIDGAVPRRLPHRVRPGAQMRVHGSIARKHEFVDGWRRDDAVYERDMGDVKFAPFTKADIFTPTRNTFTPTKKK